MNKMMTAIVAAGLLTVPAQMAFAGEQDFTVVNKTGYPITGVFATHVGDHAEGRNALSRSLDDGKNVTIHFTGYSKNSCHWDVHVKVGNKPFVVNNVDLCEVQKLVFRVNKQGQLTYREL